MFQLGNTLVSEDILEREFACNLTACKGICCVEGEAGAPLEEEEIRVLEKLYPRVKPFLRQEGIDAIASQGPYVKGEDGDWETPLVNNKECAYVVFDKHGIAKCGLEAAYNAGETRWQKPVSCHLYPVRVKEYSTLTAVNYHKWQICSPACTLGEKLNVPVYKFVKEALVRKFGEAWYAELEQVAREHLKS